MATTTRLSPFLTLESSSSGEPISSPSPALQRDEHAGSHAPSAFELEQLSRKPTSSSARQTRIERPTASSSRDLEMSPPASPAQQGVSEIVPSLNNPPRNKWRFAASCTSLLAYGLNDASTGALIPYMEAQYGIEYGTVSLIFVFNALGYIICAAFCNRLEKKLGRARHMAMTSAFMVAGYAILVATPPFPLVCLAFFLVGVGVALGLAPTSVFTCGLSNATVLLGFLYGSYGIGGTLGPLIGTAMVDRGIRWSRFYAVALTISAFNTAINLWSNQGYETDRPDPLLVGARQREDSAIARDAAQPTNQGESTLDSETQGPNQQANATRAAKPSWRQTLSRATLSGAFFIFAYQGAEVSISGWVLSFLLAYRVPPFKSSAPPTGVSGFDPLHASASSTGALGYVTSGFWAGLTLSRLLITDRLSKFMGPVWSVAVLTILSACFQFLLWLAPNVVAESVSVAILGIILGPIYPLGMLIIARYIDRKLQVSSLAVVTAFGSSGGAVGPLLVGVVSQTAGVWVLHPICLGLYVGMAVCWFALNKGRSKRTD